MTTPDYVVVGHVTKDLRPGGFTMGGTATYAAAAAQRLGRRFIVADAAADAIAIIRARLAAQAAALTAAGTPPPPVAYR